MDSNYKMQAEIPNNYLRPADRCRILSSLLRLFVLLLPQRDFCGLQNLNFFNFYRITPETNWHEKGKNVFVQKNSISNMFIINVSLVWFNFCCIYCWIVQNIGYLQAREWLLKKNYLHWKVENRSSKVKINNYYCYCIIEYVKCES